MALSESASLQNESVSAMYGLTRALLRLWARLTGRRCRVLNDERLSGAAVGFLAQPGDKTLISVLPAALARQVCMILPRRLAAGVFAKVFAWLLGAILYDSGEGDTGAAFEPALAKLSEGKTVVVFANHAPGGADSRPAQYLAAASLAIEAARRLQSNVAIVPAYLSYPVSGGKEEIVIDFAQPLRPEEHAADGGGAQSLAAALHRACRQNPFQLRPEDLHNFFADLEETFRMDLEEDWPSRQSWKQKPEGLGLSGFAEQWLSELNIEEPGRVIHLSRQLEAHREARRRFMLGRFEVEEARAWLKPWREALVWAESVAGLPVALYGFLNHVAVLAVLFATGTLRRARRGIKRPPRRVLEGVAIVLIYAAQIFICAYFFNRAIAAVYAPSLPISGAYLWRYLWLLRNRTRLVWLARRERALTSRLRGLRKAFLRELDRARNSYADLLGVPH